MEEKLDVGNRLAHHKEPHSHLGFLLWNASRKFLGALRHELAKRGYDDLSATHVNVMPMIDATGTTAQVLAARIGVSKQATGRIVGELERLGYVRRVPDPEDARGRLILFTEKGQDLLDEGELAKTAIENLWLYGLEKDDVATMKQVLATITAQQSD